MLIPFPSVHPELSAAPAPVSHTPAHPPVSEDWASFLIIQSSPSAYVLDSVPLGTSRMCSFYFCLPLTSSVSPPLSSTGKHTQASPTPKYLPLALYVLLLSFCSELHKRATFSESFCPSTLNCSPPHGTLVLFLPLQVTIHKSLQRVLDYQAHWMRFGPCPSGLLC